MSTPPKSAGQALDEAHTKAARVAEALYQHPNIFIRNRCYAILTPYDLIPIILSTGAFDEPTPQTATEDAGEWEEFDGKEARERGYKRSPGLQLQEYDGTWSSTKCAEYIPFLAGIRYRRKRPVQQTVEELQKELTAAKDEVEKHLLELAAKDAAVEILQDEITRLRAENAWVAVTDHFPTKDDADKHGQVEVVFDPKSDNASQGANHLHWADRSLPYAAWRRTNLPTLPAPVVEDEFELWDKEYTSRPEFKNSGWKEDRKAAWNAAKTSTGGKP
jgi:hypothetical protein